MRHFSESESIAFSQKSIFRKRSGLNLRPRWERDCMRTRAIQALESGAFYSSRKSSLMGCMWESIESLSLSCNFISRQLSGFQIHPSWEMDLLEIAGDSSSEN